MPALSRTFVLRGEQNAQQLWAFLKANWIALANAGKPLAVTVTEHKAKRSVDQNKRYWAILNEIAAGAWVGGKQFSTEAWHEFMKVKFIGAEETPDGRLIGISTTVLSVPEFADFMTRVEAYAAEELSIEIS